MATSLTLEAPISVESLSPPPTASVLPPLSTEVVLPGRVTLSHGPAAAALPMPTIDTPDIVRLRQWQRARLRERLFSWSIGGLMLLSGGVAVYRLLWMGW